MLNKFDFIKHLHQLWSDRGFPVPEGDHIGVSMAEMVEHSAERNKKIDLPYVELWVEILDQHLSWFISLCSTIYDGNRGTLSTDFQKSAFLILSKIIADSTAMRHLILLGFDTSARAILRSVSEYMEVFVVLMHQPEFATEFLKSDTPADAQKFWNTHLRSGGLRKKVTVAWQDYFQGENIESATWFANWGRGSNIILSGLTHPSSIGGLFAAIPLKAEYPQENWLGFWGDKADVSVETIFIYLQFVFPVLLLSRDFPFSGYDSHMQCAPYDEGNELHRHVRIGREILASIILSLNKDSNVDHVFPKLDLSIFPGEEEA